MNRTLVPPPAPPLRLRLCVRANGLTPPMSSPLSGRRPRLPQSARGRHATSFLIVPVSPRRSPCLRVAVPRIPFPLLSVLCALYGYQSFPRSLCLCDIPAQRSDPQRHPPEDRPGGIRADAHHRRHTDHERRPAADTDRGQNDERHQQIEQITWAELEIAGPH